MSLIHYAGDSDPHCVCGCVTMHVTVILCAGDSDPHRVRGVPSLPLHDLPAVSRPSDDPETLHLPGTAQC